MSDSYPCPHAQNIGAMIKTVDRLEQVIDGNGNVGVLKDVTVLKMEVRDMCESLDNLATSYSALVRSQVEHDTIDRINVEERKKRSSAFQRVGTLFAIIFGLVATLFVVLNYIQS